MQNPRLAARYAKSLLDLTLEQNNTEQVLHDMRMLHEICAQSQEFVLLLRSPIVHADKKAAIVQAVLQDKANQLTLAFINLLIRKGREENLPEIATAFVKQYKELKNIRTVHLTTAVPLRQDIRDKIFGKVAASLPNNQVEMVEKVNPEILGGFVLEMDDKLFDASIRNDLNEVKMQFKNNIYVKNIR